MLRNLANRNSHKFVSRWVILAIDVFIVAFSVQVAFLLRFNFQLDFVDKYPLGGQFLIVIVTYVIGFSITKPFSGIIRHTSLKDLEKLLAGNMIALVVGLAINFTFLSSVMGSYYRIPLSIFFIQFLIVTFVMAFERFFIRSLYRSLVRKGLRRKRVMIYGAGKAGLHTKTILEQDVECAYQVIAFIDDNPSKVGKNLEGLPVLPAKKVQLHLETSRIEEVIIAISRIDPDEKRNIINRLIEFDVVVKNIPPVSQWIDGEFSTGQIKQVRIEDLLGRAPIKLDQRRVRNELEGRVILVTGAAGSIGSEIVRQVVEYNPMSLILIDQAESDLYNLMVDLKQKIGEERSEIIKPFICDVSNLQRVERLFAKYKPDVVYHAAAYKHVPLMESNPSEAIEVNIFGTKNVADLAIKHKVERFVLVSTDKAVNPTNVMGASKRIAEMYCQAMDSPSTRFITTRFGNVLGSNGSVIPLFRRQIRNGGPVSVTHPEITRYFMTIPEACELVLEAGAMGEGGEIFVFDMGEPIKIYDLARKMIKLSGFQEEEIQIKITGLRPGEKLYEEVLSKGENIKRTYHPKISIARVRFIAKKLLNEELNVLRELIMRGEDVGIVKQMKNIVPEFKSKNSNFQLLDEGSDPQKTDTISAVS